MPGLLGNGAQELRDGVVQHDRKTVATGVMPLLRTDQASIIQYYVDFILH